MAFNRDGSRLLAGLLHSFEGQKPVVLDYTGGSWDVQWDPNGDRFLVGSRTMGVLNMYDKDGKHIRTLNSTPIEYRIAPSPDGRTLAISERFEQAVRFISIDGIPQGWYPHGGGTFDWHPSGKYFVVNSGDRVIHVVETDSQKLVNKTNKPHFEGALVTRFEPTQGDVVALGFYSSCALWRWQVESAPQKIFPALTKLRDVNWTPDGTKLLFT